jgi:hypothetical protein
MVEHVMVECGEAWVMVVRVVGGWWGRWRVVIVGVVGGWWSRRETVG